MGIRITGNQTILENNLTQAQKDAQESMERLSSGVRFTKGNPIPAERAQSDNLTAKMAEMNSYKKNTGEGLSLTEFADSNLSEISNMNIRMRELVNQAASPSLSDKERQFLFVEYQSLYDEIDRLAATASYKGETLLNFKEGNRTEIGFRVGPPTSKDGKNLNVIKIENLEDVHARSKELGLISAQDLLDSNEGISLDDVLDNFDADDIDELNKSFDRAQENIMSYRAKFGATTTRLNHAQASIDIAYENIAAANSKIKDVDYASEITNLTKANILIQASTSLLAQSQQQQSQTILTLIRSNDK